MDQMALSLEPGLATRYASSRECLAHCIYQRGLGRVASELDVAPSNLSAMLSGDRALPVDLLERYVVAFKDPTPARYIAARYLQDPMLMHAAAMAAIPDAVATLANLMAAAGLQLPAGKSKR